MEMVKIVNLDAEELALASRQAAEQIFRLRFQLSMGQSEGLKKLRELKKDIARFRTVERQRELGIAAPAATAESKPKRTKKPAKVRSKAKTARSVKTASSAAKRASARKAGRKASQSAGRANPSSRSRSRAAGRGNANSKKGS